MQQQAIPKFLNLGAIKPAAIPAYTRRVQSIATNAQSFTEGSVANIMIDTSSPGSFLDPGQSIITFDLTITNTNPYIDYVNLSTCGVAALISEMRIICQGTPIEEILSYNTMFEMWMDLGGYAQQEFKMYVENSWRAPIFPGGTDSNFVKPPMVDREGIIMCPNNINMFGSASQVHNENGNYFLSRVSNTAGSIKNEANGQNIGRFPGTVANKGSNYAHSYLTTDPYTSTSIAPGTIRSRTWTDKIDNTYVTWPSTLRPEMSTQQSFTQKINESSTKYRLQDYMQFLANVKNIPIGISPIKSFLNSDAGSTVNNIPPPTAYAMTSNQINTGNWNFSGTPAHMVNANGSITFSVSLPIFSGVLGLWAEKAFPTMLIAPGSMYIQLKFAAAKNAFQFAMDPCRRIAGTYRDYVPNYGLVYGYATEWGGNNLSIAFNSTQVGPLFTNGTPSNTMIALTTNGTNGTDYAWQGIMNNTLATGIVSTFDQMLSASSTVNSVNTVQGIGEGTCTGISKPQYVPMDTPWLYGGGWNFSNFSTSSTLPYAPFCPTYVEETKTCFGTYLPASTPQVRRTIVDTFLNGNYSAPPITNIPTYRIDNLAYVGQQIILPDEVSASLVRMAADGDISIHSQSCRTYQVNASQANSQSILLPIKVASAKSLFILFQNSIMTDNPYYCSQTRNNPFIGYKWNQKGNGNGTSSYFVGSDAPPTITAGSTSNPFSIQLRLGNDLLPVQPITNYSSVLYELERSIHGSQDMLTSIPTLFGYRHFRSTTNVTPSNNIGSSGSNGTEVTCLRNNDFTTPFIPVAALDDQTITDNAAFRDYPTALTTGLLPSTYVQAMNRGTYVHNAFLPPISKFLLGFDLETFPNQSDVSRSGRYLGNGPITLQMSNVYACGQSSMNGNPVDNYNVLAVVLHDIRFSIIAGGQMLAYY